MNAIERRELPERDGFKLSAALFVDEDAKPGDYDCYTDKDVIAFLRDDWGFFGVVVTATREGVELGSSSLWGIDGGQYPSGESADPWYCVDDIADEAIGEATAALGRLCAAQPPKV